MIMTKDTITMALSKKLMNSKKKDGPYETVFRNISSMKKVNRKKLRI
jgi:ribosomal protein L20A (L18A)